MYSGPPGARQRDRSATALSILDPLAAAIEGEPNPAIVAGAFPSIRTKRHSLRRSVRHNTALKNSHRSAVFKNLTGTTPSLRKYHPRASPANASRKRPSPSQHSQIPTPGACKSATTCAYAETPAKPAFVAPPASLELQISPPQRDSNASGL